MSRSTETRERGDSVDVDFARVCLRSDGVRVGESGDFCHEFVELFNLKQNVLRYDGEMIELT